MYHRLLILTTVFFFLLLLLPPKMQGQSGCIQFATIEATPVQCNSFRNGFIHIKEVIGGTPPYYYSIDGTTYSTRPLFDLLWPGEYLVSIRDSSGCAWIDTVKVTEPPIFTATLTASKDSITKGEVVHLTAEVSPVGTIVQSVSWRPPALFSNPNEWTQQVSLYENTPIAVEIVNEAGCTARDQLLISVRKPTIYAPNIMDISSNEDAYFTLFSDAFVKQINLLQVYNRFGGLLFERRDFSPNDPLLGWNGRQDGKVVPEGVYGWIAEIEYLDGQRQMSAGSITLLH